MFGKLLLQPEDLQENSPKMLIDFIQSFVKKLDIQGDLRLGQLQQALGHSEGPEINH